MSAHITADDMPQWLDVLLSAFLAVDVPIGEYSLGGEASHRTVNAFLQWPESSLIQFMRIFGGLEGKESNRNLLASSISICLGIK